MISGAVQQVGLYRSWGCTRLAGSTYGAGRVRARSYACVHADLGKILSHVSTGVALLQPCGLLCQTSRSCWLDNISLLLQGASPCE
jgi:hypothetical protein